MSGVTAANGTGPNPFNGWFVVNSILSTTQFTYFVNSNPANGSASTGTGGTVASWNSNHVTWTAATGATNGALYLIYRGSTLIGVSWPQNSALAGDTTYLAFDDFGSTVTSLPNPPKWASSTPQASATNDMLVTTIVSGAGTTSLTLANAATNSVTAAVTLFDDAVTTLAAATAAHNSSSVVLPYGGIYVFNSPITLPSNSDLYIAGAALLNETINVSNSTIRGISDFGGQPSFAWKAAPQVIIGTANPGIYTTANAYFYNITLQNSSNNGANMVVMDLSSAIPGSIFDGVSFAMTPGGTEYSNMALVFRGTHTNSGAVSTFNNVLFSSSQNGNLTSVFPAFYVDNGGDVKFSNLFFSGKGMLLRPTVSGAYIDGNVIYSQGNYMPFFSLTNAYGGGTAGVTVKLDTCVADTTFLPVIANLGGAPSGGLIVAFDQRSCGNPSAATVTGVQSMAANVLDSQNISARGPSSPTTFDGDYFNNVTAGPGAVPQYTYDTSVRLGPAFSLFAQDAVPAAPTCATASAGPPFTSSGTWTFKFAWIYVNGGTGNLSPASSSCTANGTSQQITVTLPSSPQAAGATGAFVYASTNTGAGPWATIGSATPSTSTQTFLYTANFTVYTAPANPGSGPAGIGPGG